jgi:serine/threonine protein kinase
MTMGGRKPPHSRAPPNPTAKAHRKPPHSHSRAPPSPTAKAHRKPPHPHSRAPTANQLASPIIHKLGEPGKEGLVTLVHSSGYARKTFRNSHKSVGTFEREIKFQKEAAAAGLSPQIHASGRDRDGRLYFEMDALHETLRDVAHRACSDSGAQALMRGAETQILRLMNGLDKLRILHGDSSAMNFMFDRTGRMYVIDFGMSKRIRDLHNTSPAIMHARLLNLTRTLACPKMTRQQVADTYFPRHAQAQLYPM